MQECLEFRLPTGHVTKLGGKRSKILLNRIYVCTHIYINIYIDIIHVYICIYIYIYICACCHSTGGFGSLEISKL